MKRNTLLLWVVALVLCVSIAHAANDNGFEFPEWFVVIMNALIVPFVVQWVKNITQVREVRAVIAGIFSFITAIAGILITGEPFSGLLGLFVLAYSIAQVSYNLFWHAILQGNDK